MPSTSELLGYRKAGHDGLEGMLMDIGSTVGVGVDFGFQPIHIPKFRRRSMGVQQIVDAD